MTHNLWVEEMKDNLTVQRVQHKTRLNTDKAQQRINRKQQAEAQLTIRMWNRAQHNNKLELQTMLNHQQLKQQTHLPLEELLKIKKAMVKLLLLLIMLEQLQSAITY